MKKHLFYLSFCLLLFTSSAMMAAEKKTPITEQAQMRIKQLETRVLEIKSMDQSQLSAQERKALRKELYGIKKEMKGLGGGVYLSAAAIIIIILVLILIL